MHKWDAIKICGHIIGLYIYYPIRWVGLINWVNALRFTQHKSSSFRRRNECCIFIAGPSLAVDTACATSLYLIDHAVRSIRSGQCDAAVVAVANTILHPRSCLIFRDAGVLSPDGTSKAFDASGLCHWVIILLEWINTGLIWICHVGHGRVPATHWPATH